MKTARFLLLGCLGLALAQPANAAQLFLSESSGPPVSLPPTAPHLTLAPGATGALYLWVIPDVGQTIDGLGLSLTTSAPGVVSLTNNTVYNPANASLVDRWENVGVGNANGPGYLFRDSNAVAVFTRGLDLDASAIAGEPLFDPVSKAYLHAKIDLLAGPAPGATQLSLEVGEQLVTIRDQGVASGLLLGPGGNMVSGGDVGASSGIPTAVVTVVPEPSTLVLMVLALTVDSLILATNVSRRRSRLVKRQVVIT